MMKISYIVLVLALTTYARIEDIAKLERSKFGKVLLNTVAIQLSVSEGRVSEVVNILTDLKYDIQQEQNDHQIRHDKYQIDTQLDIDNYNTVIDNATQDYNGAVSDIEIYTPLKDQTKIDLDAEKVSLAKLQEDLKNAIAKRNKEHEEFVKRQAGYDASIQSSKKAIELVSQLNTGSTQFLQMPILVQIVEGLPAVRSVAPSRAALLRVLVQLSTSKHANPETVTKCLNLISKLQLSLETSKQEDIDQEDKAVANYNIYIETVNQSILASEIKITELETAYEDYKQKVDSAVIRRDLAEQTIEENIKLRDDIQKLKDEEQANYDRETERRNEEIAIVDEAVELLNNRLGDMSDYVASRVTEDEVTASK